MSQPFPAAPLNLTLTLDQLTQQHTSGPALFATPDPFDALDSHHASLTASHPIDSSAQASASTSAQHSTLAPLQDSVEWLIPGVNISNARAEGSLSPWLEQLSGRVTALAVGGGSSAGGAGPSAGAAVRGRRKQQRVALGTESGLVWLLASKVAASQGSRSRTPSPPPTPGSSLSEARRSSLARRPSHESLHNAQHSPTSPNTSNTSQAQHPPFQPPTSPPTSPRPFVPRSRQLSFNGRPKLSHRSSSTSVVSRRVSTPASPTTAPSMSFELPSHRARKASATVSITTGTTGDSPPKSQQPNSTARSQATSALTPSKGKNTSPKLPSMVVSSPSPNRHRKAKDSIATGIGLWETESVASVSRTSLAEDGWGFGSPGEGTPVEEREEVLFEEEEGELELGELEVVARVRSRGSGPVVAIEVLRAEGTHWAREEGEALLVLRRDGALSLLSLVDGRAFVSCDAGKEIAADSQQGSVLFDGFKVVQLGGELVALCYGHNRAGLVIVELNTFIAQPPVENKAEGRLYPAIIRKQGSQHLVYAAPSPNSSTQSELLVRTIAYEPAVLDEEEAEQGTTRTSLVKPAVIRMEEVHSAGTLEGLTGPVQGLRNVEDDLIAWDANGALLFALRDGRIAILAHLQMSDIVDVSVMGGEILLISTADEAHFFRLVRSAKALNGSFDIKPLATESLMGAQRVQAVRTVQLGQGQGVYSFVVSSEADDGERKLERVTLDSTIGSATENAPEVVKVNLLQGTTSSDQAGHARIPDRVTASVKLDESDSVVLGLSSGAIHHLAVTQLGAGLPASSLSTPSLPGAVTVLSTVTVQDRVVLLAGGIDGSAAAWYVDDWTPVGQWSLFASPISNICPLFSPDSPSSTLEACVAFVSLNSPIALVSLHPSGPELLFILPGTKSGVEKIATRGNEVIVVYCEGLARVCDVAGRELRRSMDRRTARGVLKEEGWAVWFDAERKEEQEEGSSQRGSVTDPTFEFDVRVELDEAAKALPWALENARSPLAPALSRQPSSNGTQLTPKLAQIEKTGSSIQDAPDDHLALIRVLLAQAVTWDVDPATDALLTDELFVARPAHTLPLALRSPSALALPNISGGRTEPWCVSPATTAHRLLSIIALLRVFLNFPGTERPASQLVLFYTSHLAAVVGNAFEAPALGVFAELWLDKQAEVRESARMLFGSYLAVSSPEEVASLVEYHADALPSRQVLGAPSTGQREDSALLLLGLVGCELFKLLPAPVLRDIALSLASYLTDEAPFHRQLIAAELCAKGFGTWQNYVDAPALVRQLCGLATGRLAGTPAELRAVGRQAVLHVAGANAPLFMTTLLHDLGKEEAERRNATLKLLGFLIRKKPLVLHTSLPRIAEAVVKSLDPTVTSLRETVHQAATVILSELVRAYPFIAFHHKSQRLAVGTHEGSTILYDLKTATRLYVLEGHSQPVTALTFSPDGRRLVSVSLDEGKCVVWKVGVGVWSLFTPGSAPRQGAEGGAPWKVLDFAVGDEGRMTLAAQLEWVVFEWPAERTVRLRIRETALTFSV